MNENTPTSLGDQRATFATLRAVQTRADLGAEVEAASEALRQESQRMF